ncbi:MAG: hypothetical protein ABEJ94_01115 [Halorientalis sp.]
MLLTPRRERRKRSSRLGCPSFDILDRLLTGLFEGLSTVTDPDTDTDPLVGRAERIME